MVNKKCYYLYNRNEVSDEDMKNYRKGRLEPDKDGKISDIVSGKIYGYVDVITPLYTEGHKKLKNKDTKGEKHKLLKDENKLSLATTFKSQIRITADIMAPKMSRSIFGDLDEKSKVEFVEKNIVLPNGKTKEYSIKVPNSYGPRIAKDRQRLYFNQVNRIKNLNDNPIIQLKQFQDSIDKPKVELNNIYIPKTKIEFEIHFDKLTPGELNLLLKALILKDDYYHQIGYGKNYGLGTIKVNIVSVNLKSEQRYNSLFNNKYDRNITTSVLEKAKKTIDKSLSKPEFITYKKENVDLNLANIYDIKLSRY